MIGLRVAPGERQFAEENILVDESESRTPEGAEFVQAGSEVSAFVQFFISPGCFYVLFEIREFSGSVISRRQGLVYALCRQHAGLDRRVGALDFDAVQESRTAASEHAAREAQLGK